METRHKRLCLAARGRPRLDGRHPFGTEKCEKADFDRFAKVFKDYNQYTHVSIHDNRFDMGLERCKTFYGMHWDDGTLYFLKAKKLGNEFCVPIDWINLSYYNGGESHPDYWGSIDAPTRRLLGLSHLWSSVKRNFVFMNRASVNWDSLYVAMIPQIKATTTDGEAVRLLQRMAATLNDGHTFVYSYYPQDMRSMPFPHVGLTVRCMLTRCIAPPLRSKVCAADSNW